MLETLKNVIVTKIMFTSVISNSKVDWNLNIHNGIQ
jgi:hypothetical protein